MKSIMTMAFIVCLLHAANAQQFNKAEALSDSSRIVQVLNDYYFKGIYLGDTTTLKQAFDERTLLFGDIKGVPYYKTVQQYVYGVGHRRSPKDSGNPFHAEIMSIDVINTIAVAKTHVKMYDLNYYNFITFHKFRDKWLIINKTLTHVEK